MKHASLFTRLLCTVLSLICILSLSSVTAFAQSYGIIGSVLTTDIKAYINGAEIPAYNVDGNMVIVGSDLRNYGFTVVYDNNTRTSSVTYDGSNPTWEPIYSEYGSDGSIGVRVMDVYDTDISVLVNGNYVTGYNVDGKMAFKFSELKVFGEYYYDNASRSTNLTLGSGELLTVSHNNLNIASQTAVTVTVKGIYSIWYEIADDSIISCEWGEWVDGYSIPLTIIPKCNGNTTVSVYIEEIPESRKTISVTVTGQSKSASTLTVTGVGEEFASYHSDKSVANICKISSIEYEKTTYNDSVTFMVDVVAALTECNIDNRKYIAINYELYDESNICVENGYLWKQVNDTNQLYSERLYFSGLKQGAYILVFKDYGQSNLSEKYDVKNTSTLTIEGIGEEFEYWWSAKIRNTSKLVSAEYTIKESSDKINISIDVEAQLLESIGGATSIKIGCELFDERGVCVKTGYVWMKSSHYYQLYSDTVLFVGLKPGNYVLKFKDYVA